MIGVTVPFLPLYTPQSTLPSHNAHSHVPERARARAHPRYSSPTFHAALYPELRLSAYPRTPSRRRQVTRWLCVCIPCRPKPSLQRGWMGGWLRLWGREPEIERHPVSRGGKGARGDWGRGARGGRAAVTDKRKSVSEGNPIGGRRHRDVPTSLVHLRSTGRGDAGLVGEEGVVASLATITRRQSGYGRNPAWRRPDNNPLGAAELSPTANHHNDARRRSLPITRTHFPGSRSICSGDHFRNRKFDRGRLIAPLTTPFECWFFGDNDENRITWDFLFAGLFGEGGSYPLLDNINSDFFDKYNTLKYIHVNMLKNIN